MQSTSQEILKAIAKDGNPAAIATLLNQIFQPHQITVKVSVNGNSLKIVLISEEITDKSTLLFLLMQEINYLSEMPLDKIKVHCHKKVKSFIKDKYLEKKNYNIWIHEQDIPKNNQHIHELKILETASSTQKLPNNGSESEKTLKEYKKISQVEFQQALQSCKNSAKSAYNMNLKYAKEIEDILQLFYDNLQGKNSNLFNLKKLKESEIASLLNNIISNIEQILNKDIEALRLSLATKKTHLEDYTIALFGRTKAGKSTIREALTRGNGSTIGKGAQRTTREVYEYQWQGLRLIDTPGIEAYQGEDDTAKANEIIDQADMVIFLTSDESVQAGEFEAMAKLEKINKHFVVLLNIKENLDNPKRLQRFLQNPRKVFDEQRLIEHHHHLINNINQHLGIEQVDIIDIQAMAAFLSTQPEHKDISTQLWESSRLEEVYSLIAEDIYYCGNHRRKSTFFDGTSLFLGQIEANLSVCKASLQEQIYFLETKQKDIKKLFNEFIKDSQRKIENKVKEIFSKLQQETSCFVDNNIGTEKAEEEWKKIEKKYSDKLQDSIKRGFQEIHAELKERLQEFEKEYNYDAENSKFDLNIDNLNKGQTGDFLKTLGLVCSGVAAVAFVAVNWWNPAGWVVTAGWVSTGLGMIAGIVSGRVKDNEKKEFNQKREDLKNDLKTKINDKQSKTIDICNNQVETQLTKIRDEILKAISSPHKNLSSISEDIEKTINLLQALHENLKRDCSLW